MRCTIASLSHVLSIILILLPGRASAGLITVPTDYSTVQAAIDAAIDGDEIVALRGTYVEDPSISGIDITLRSTDPMSSSVVASTNIDGVSSETVVTFSGSESSACALSGFPIKGAHRGIVGTGTTAMISQNTVRNNGRAIFECDGAIQHNAISHHWNTICGTGPICRHGEIEYNTVSDNYAGPIAGESVAKNVELIGHVGMPGVNIQ